MILPEQSISVEEAFVSYSTGAAACLLSDNETCMIRVALAGDLVVRDRDILSIRPLQAAQTQVWMTIVGGSIV